MEQVNGPALVRPEPERGTTRRAEAPARPKLVEPADLYRIPFWVLLKLVYAFAPISLLLRLATLRGAIASFVSPLRAEARDAIERHRETNARDARVLVRRHFEYRSRARFARLWPQIRGFAGAERIEVEGLRHLDDALAAGRGAVLVSGHFGYSRLIKPILRSRGRDVLLVGNLRPGMPDFRPEMFGLPPFTRVGSFVHSRLLGLPRWSRFHPRFQETTGIDLPVTMNVRPHVAALERNAALVILADGRHAQALRTESVAGVRVDFAPGALSLARATGVRALPVFVVDDPTSRRGLGLRLVVHPPLELQRTADPADDAGVNLKRFAEVYEAQVRACPQDWHWHAVRDGALDPLLVER